MLVTYWPRKSHFLTGGGVVVVVPPLPCLATDSTLPVLVKVGHVTPHTQFGEVRSLSSTERQTVTCPWSPHLFNYSYYTTLALAVHWRPGDNQDHY